MKKGLLKVGIISGCLTCLLGTTAFAYVPVIGGKLSRGVGAMCYYVDRSANAYVSSINTGINRWTNSGFSPRNFIRMTAVSSNRATDVDYYAVNAEDMLSFTALAMTEYFKPNGSGTGGAAPYYYAEITINKDAFGRRSSFEKIGTMAHEFGHALGLEENNNDTSKIMCQLGSGRSVNRVSAEEYAKVVSIYGGE